MNTDAKIFKKILTNLIQQYIKGITDCDQVGFNTGVQRSFNICKSFNVIYHVNNRKDKNHILISIDRKVKILHPFKIKTLIKIGLEG